MSASFTFDGVDASAYGLTVLRGPEPLAADPRLHRFELGGVSGEAVGSTGLRGTFFTVVCLVQSSTRTQLFERMHAVNALIDPLKGPRLLVFDREDGMDAEVDFGYYAIRNGPLRTEFMGHTARQFNIDWMVQDGVKVTPDAQGQSATVINSDPEQVFEPTGASDVVLGNRYAHPVWTLKNTDAGTLSSFSITNLETGEVFSWTGSLSQNQYIRFDARPTRMYAEKLISTGRTITVADSTSEAVTVDAEGTIVAGDLIVVGNEDMKVLAVTSDGSDLLFVERGVNRSTKSAHSAVTALRSTNQMTAATLPRGGMLRLMPGLRNELSVAGVTAGELTISYRGEFL